MDAGGIIISLYIDLHKIQYKFAGPYKKTPSYTAEIKTMEFLSKTPIKMVLSELYFSVPTESRNVALCK